MKRENNRVKNQIIMQQQKPQELIVRLQQYQIEDLFVVVDLV